MAQENKPESTQVITKVSQPQTNEPSMFSSFVSSMKNFKWEDQQKKYNQTFFDIDHKIARTVTDFKQQYILTLGDMRVRSIITAVSGAVLYKLISFRTVGTFSRMRNLGVSFGVVGLIFIPQLFNPMIYKLKK